MMKNKNLRTDLSFISIILLIFLYFIFLIYQQEYLLDNFLIACVVFIIVIITYFTNLTTGLIINAIVIFGHITFVIYQSLTKGVVIRPYTYFWTFMSPALTTAISMFSMAASSLQKEISSLREKLIGLSTLDEVTKLKNLRAFENDANVYSKIAKRYESDFGIIVLAFKYQKELERLCSKESMHQIILLVSNVIRNSLRTEDEMYQLDNKDVLFGVLLLTRKESSGIIEARLRNDISEIDTNSILNTKQLRLEMRIGIAFVEDSESPLELIEMAKRQMRFDV